MYDENYQINQKIIKRRQIVGWLIFVVLIIFASLEYVSYIFVLMISIPIMSIVVYLNSNNDSSIENNKQRLFLLASTLALISFSAYWGQYQQDRRASEVLNYCYEHSNNSSICDEMNGILNPESIDE